MATRAVRERGDIMQSNKKPLEIASTVSERPGQVWRQLSAAALEHYQNGHWQEAQAAALVAIALRQENS
jgi:hypothetical protein